MKMLKYWPYVMVWACLHPEEGRTYTSTSAHLDAKESGVQEQVRSKERVSREVDLEMHQR